jgi:dienelactone hydrolase
MTTSEVHRPLPEAPARAVLREAGAEEAWPGTRSDLFEIVSRGDFVPGRLHRPAESGDAPLPLLLLIPDPGRETRPDALAFAADWVRQGMAVATIDLPLFGDRASPKLSERLALGLERVAKGTPSGRETALDPETGALVEEFARQSTSDLIRTLDALSALPGIDASRVAFMGIGVGAMVGSYLLAHDARLRAAALAFPAGGAGPRSLDPARHLARSRAAALLLVAPAPDDPAQAKATQACLDAAPEPKRLLHASGSGRALEATDLVPIRDFLADALGL